jgi:hypothetical protein
MTPFVLTSAKHRGQTRHSYFTVVQRVSCCKLEVGDLCLIFKLVSEQEERKI